MKSLNGLPRLVGLKSLNLLRRDMFRTLLAFVGSIALSSASVKDCNPSSYFAIKKLEFFPDPPIINENATLYTEFYNPGYPMSEGIAVTSLVYNFIPFEPTTEQLCNTEACPIEPGITLQTNTFPWPDLSGFVEMKLEWFGTDGTSLLCIDINTQSGYKMLRGGN